ncbi:MAG: ATP-dependent zinc metalloprotease FtsH [Lachnospira sp.]|nr:ATP-dependent zinc metalloprotease FtsH [Lachnospira sp.]
MDNNYYNNDHHGQGGGQGGGGNGGPRGPKINAIIVAIIAAVLMFAAISGMSSMIRGATYKEKSYTEFLADVEAGLVDEVDFTSDRITYTLKSDTESNISGLKLTYYTGQVNDDDLIPTLKANNVNIVGYIPSQSNSILEFFVIWVLPMILIYVVFALIYRRMAKSGGDIMGMGVGKSTAKVYVQKDTGVTFKDVAGEDEAKDSLMQIVDFLHNPGKYQQIGAKLPKGALLVGPPGTGKTLLAKAVAGEAKVPFFSLAGSDFVEMFVGVGASRVRDLFKEAQKMAPAIIFIDEIDAIGKSRDSRYGGNDEREQTLNQLLAEMDGFDSSKGLFILAATNRPEILDKALLRPGRFDRRIIVDKPDLKGRVAILKVHAKDVRMDDTVDLNAIALATSGAVGSDLANIINEGAIAAVEAGRRAVSQKDLMDAVEVVIAGKEKKDRIMNDQEKRTVAYHEVGHALIAALKKHSEPVQKITIVPRTMGALGYVLQTPEEERYLLSKDELLTRLVTFMGGRAAEEIVFNTVTTGASNDIEQATKVARAMITQYGMSEKFGLMALETVEDQYLSGRTVMNCSDATAAQIDEEVKTVLKQAYDEAKRILSENRDILDKIAEYLYEKETITGEEFMNILHLVETERAQAEEAAIEEKEQSAPERQEPQDARPGSTSEDENPSAD